jgi:hypothetical protein
VVVDATYEEPVVEVPDDFAVQRAITQYAQKQGMPAARELLEKFGAKKVGEVPMDKRAEFVAAATLVTEAAV